MRKRELIDKTKEILKPGYNDNCLCTSELECVRSETPQKCILVFGINPAGDEKDAVYEDNSLYLYHLPDYNIKDRTYSKFNKPIFDIVSRATNNNAKWGWCNYNTSEIKEIINKDQKLRPHFDVILNHYSEYKDKEYSIYIGEFFYYHMTNQSEFLKMIDSSKLNDYLIEMLNMHIEEIVNHNNAVSCIYINNATISGELCKALDIDGYPSYIDYKYQDCSIRIFFGSMLSGQRSMDVFSKDRLTNEMKEYLQNR